jgi:hypothetical protein
MKLMVEDKHAEIGNVGPDFLGQLAVILGDAANENGPELAVVKQRLIELAFARIPTVADRLEPCCCTQQYGRFKLPRIRRLLVRLRIGLGCAVLHYRATISRTRSGL